MLIKIFFWGQKLIEHQPFNSLSMAYKMAPMLASIRLATFMVCFFLLMTHITLRIDIKRFFPLFFHLKWQQFTFVKKILQSSHIHVCCNSSHAETCYVVYINHKIIFLWHVKLFLHYQHHFSHFDTVLWAFNTNVKQGTMIKVSFLLCKMASVHFIWKGHIHKFRKNSNLKGLLQHKIIHKTPN